MLFYAEEGITLLKNFVFLEPLPNLALLGCCGIGISLSKQFSAGVCLEAPEDLMCILIQ